MTTTTDDNVDVDGDEGERDDDESRRARVPGGNRSTDVRGNRERDERLGFDDDSKSAEGERRRRMHKCLADGGGERGRRRSTMTTTMGERADDNERTLTTGGNRSVDARGMRERDECFGTGDYLSSVECRRRQRLYECFFAVGEGRRRRRRRATTKTRAQQQRRRTSLVCGASIDRPTCAACANTTNDAVLAMIRRVSNVGVDEVCRDASSTTARRDDDDDVERRQRR